jgi:DNA-directed RNA polymerase subunit M/transcription elongation factor TFIIS
VQKVKRTRPAASAPVACSNCGSNEAIQIDMTLPDGTSVHFCSCHRCENRWWDHGGRSLALDSVLDIVRQPAR